MAQPLYAPLAADSWILEPAPQQPSSPPCDRASSWDSWGSAAAAGCPVPRDARPARRSGASGRRGPRSSSSRLGCGQRQSASEREKLRMRTLARALHELRRFLPPSVAPAGQSLTKIETLRLAIRYIGHLSAVLGLSEDSLQRRRRRYMDAASQRSCPLCPDGGPAQAQTLSPDLDSAAYSGASWESPSACPGSRDVPEPCDLSLLYTKTASPEQTMVPNPSSPLFTGDVLALLETWMPLSPPEWTPA